MVTTNTLNHLKFLSTHSASAIANYLKAECKDEKSLEVVPIEGFTQPNIIFKGTSNIWLMAHYDKITDYDQVREEVSPSVLIFKQEGYFLIGNFDNGAGVATLLDLYQKYPQHNYVFTFGEEIGFWGAREMNKLIPDGARIISLDISDDCQLEDTFVEPVVYFYRNADSDLTESFVKKGFKQCRPRGNDAFVIDNKKEIISYHLQIENMHQTNKEMIEVSHFGDCIQKLEEVVKNL